MGSCCSQNFTAAGYLDKIDLVKIEQRIEAIMEPDQNTIKGIINTLAQSFSGEEGKEPELINHWMFGRWNQKRDESREKVYLFYANLVFDYAREKGALIYITRDPEGEVNGVGIFFSPNTFKAGSVYSNFYNFCKNQVKSVEKKEMYKEMVQKDSDMIMIRHQQLAKCQDELHKLHIKPTKNTQNFSNSDINNNNKNSDEFEKDDNNINNIKSNNTTRVEQSVETQEDNQSNQSGGGSKKIEVINLDKQIKNLIEEKNNQQNAQDSVKSTKSKKGVAFADQIKEVEEDKQKQIKNELEQAEKEKKKKERELLKLKKQIERENRWKNDCKLYNPQNTDSHWLIFALGVMPKDQKHGYGRSLLTLFADFCDYDQIVGYCQFVGRKNQHFLGQEGFEYKGIPKRKIVVKQYCKEKKQDIEVEGGSLERDGGVQGTVRLSTSQVVQQELKQFGSDMDLYKKTDSKQRKYSSQNDLDVIKKQVEGKK